MSLTIICDINKKYRVWSRIKVEAVVIIPYDGLHSERKGAEMALMSDSSNELQKKKQKLTYWIPTIYDSRYPLHMIEGGKRILTCSNGSLVSSVEGAIRHDLLIL